MPEEFGTMGALPASTDAVLVKFLEKEEDAGIESGEKGDGTSSSLETSSPMPEVKFGTGCLGRVLST